MIDELDLREALDGLKTDLKRGVDVEEAVSRWSREYEIPSNVLRVRFQKMTSRTPEEFATLKFEVVDRLQEALEKVSQRFERPDLVKSQPLFGSVIVDEGQRFRFVAYDGSKFWMIAEDTLHVWTSTKLSTLNRQLTAALSRKAA